LTALAHSSAELHAAFLTILPRIELHGRCFFRHKKGDKRDETIAEMVALAWKSFVNCARNGKDATTFPMALLPPGFAHPRYQGCTQGSGIGRDTRRGLATTQPLRLRVARQQRPFSGSAACVPPPLLPASTTS